MVRKKYFLVMNPSSRSGKAKKDLEKIVSTFKNVQQDFCYDITNGPDDAINITRNAIQQGYEIIVAVGGDGTICEVITGFFAEGKIVGPKLATIHVGTSPDFNRYHGIPIGIERSIEAIFRGNTKTIDIGRVLYKGFSGEDKIAYFGSNVNIGLGPMIASKANSRHRKYLGDFLGTLLACLQSLICFEGIDLKAKIDGKEIAFQKLINLTVGKDPYLASGMRVFNEISFHDGRLFILSISKRSLLSLISNIPKLYWGNLLEYEAVKMYYGKEVEVEGDFQLEFDGDVRGFLPAKVTVIPKALEVIVG